MVSALQDLMDVFDIDDVLILIILEDGFCFDKRFLLRVSRQCLNPYYAGRWFLLNILYNIEYLLILS